jgi:hypothetical protein
MQMPFSTLRPASRLAGSSPESGEETLIYFSAQADHGRAAESRQSPENDA